MCTIKCNCETLKFVLGRGHVTMQIRTACDVMEKLLLFAFSWLALLCFTFHPSRLSLRCSQLKYRFFSQAVSASFLPLSFSFSLADGYKVSERKQFPYRKRRSCTIQDEKKEALFLLLSSYKPTTTHLDPLKSKFCAELCSLWVETFTFPVPTYILMCTHFRSNSRFF